MMAGISALEASNPKDAAWSVGAFPSLPMSPVPYLRGFKWENRKEPFRVVEKRWRHVDPLLNGDSLGRKSC